MRRKRRLTWATGVVAAVAIGGGAAAAAWAPGWWPLAWSELGWDVVDRIEVRGVGRLSEADVRAWAGVPDGVRLWEVEAGPIVARLERHPWIKSAAVHKRFPGTIGIDIEERIPAALARMGRGYVLIDPDGVVLEATPLDRGLPIIVGVSEKHPEGLATAAAVLAGFRAMAPSELRAEDLVVDVTSPGDPLVILTDGSRVRFGQGEYGDKWRRYVAVFQDLRGRASGARVVDLRFRDRVVVASEAGS
ncbi:MAG: FtsQ-type POTRA domain-containing protein [Nitrospirae bacterium]|nr:FtsQ-type POTRA domain-containing protein [Nitrospirota bacterium]